MITHAILAAGALAVGVAAQVTYVDADHTTNLTLANGSPLVPTSSVVSNDDNWSIQPFGNRGSVYTTNDANVTGKEDGPMLRMTLTGLTPGFEYIVYAFFWGGDSNTNWRARTRVNRNPPTWLPGYNTHHFASSSFGPMAGLGFDCPLGPQPHANLRYDSNGIETDGHFLTPVLIHENSRWLYEIAMTRLNAVHTADQNGEIIVFIDDAKNALPRDRTWFDGLGYELAPLRFGNGCGSPSWPRIGIVGSPTVNLDFDITLTQALPNSAAALIAGFNNRTWNGRSLPFDLGAFGFNGCFLNVDPTVSAGHITDSKGAAAQTLAFTGVNGGTLYWQWIVLNPTQPMQTTEGMITLLHR